jgi:hypothetical protein
LRVTKVHDLVEELEERVKKLWMWGQEEKNLSITRQGMGHIENIGNAGESGLHTPHK